MGDVTRFLTNYPTDFQEILQESLWNSEHGTIFNNKMAAV